MPREIRMTHNRLANEPSPYLLQHKDNPVHWYPWGDEAFEEAKRTGKPVLLSIGYAACHWCHVMEKESFEDEEVAAIMNKYFICIKVDREERPDVDQLYMDAVTMLSGRGGWPLNAFALPTGEPFSGGTYFPKEHWLEALKQLGEVWRKQRARILEAANNLTHHVREANLLKLDGPQKPLDKEELKNALALWMRQMDFSFGGRKVQANKFPLPAKS